jgi:hypothetical protein
MPARRLTWLTTLAAFLVVGVAAYFAVLETAVPFSEEVARKTLIRRYGDQSGMIQQLESQPMTLSESSPGTVVWQIGNWRIDPATLRYEFVARIGFMPGGYFERSWRGGWVAREDKWAFVSICVGPPKPPCP